VKAQIEQELCQAEAVDGEAARPQVGDGLLVREGYHLEEAHKPLKPA